MPGLAVISFCYPSLAQVQIDLLEPQIPGISTVLQSGKEVHKQYALLRALEPFGRDLK